MTYYDQVAEAAAFVQWRLGALAPRVGMVLGSGLGAVADAVADPVIVPYQEIPHFPQSTVEGHSGRMVAGSLGGAPVVILQGRVHSYEGYTPREVTFPMRVLGALGVRAVVLTNAAGGIQDGYKLGQLVLLADHINMMGWNPLTGPNEPRFAIRAGRGTALLRHDRGIQQGVARFGRGGGARGGIHAGGGRVSGHAGTEL